MARTTSKSTNTTNTDRYAALVQAGVGAAVATRLGLPRPMPLRRYDPGRLCESPVLLAAVGAGPFLATAKELLATHQVTEVRDSLGESTDEKLGAVVLDVSGAGHPEELEGLRAVLAPTLKRLRPNARVVLIGTDPGTLSEPVAAAAQRALEGVVRSLAKELRAGATANLVLAQGDPNAVAPAVSSAVEFFLSGRSAYVDGQKVIAQRGRPATNDNRFTATPKPLQGKVAAVTGAARGIGADIARVLSRDGATVVCVDLPAAGQSLAAVANEVGGTALQVDVTAPGAGRLIVEHARTRQGQLDVMVHNAGITRDKLLVNMDESRWSSVIDVNLLSILRINEALLASGGLADDGRIVCVSSLSGIAGNRGQVNYAASKAGVIGVVEALAPLVAGRGITVNAVAPGFIETEMTARIPLATREAGRRMNSLRQGGLPVDVAETIAWFAQPAATGITGQVLRVCGQSLMGA